MDFYGMKRKELQALCKKHGIPANLTNGEMANRLSSLFAGGGKVETLKRTILKTSSENRGENESDVENRGPKKVRFSPENEMFEFEKSAVKYMEVKALGRRRSLINGTDIVESVTGVMEKKGGKRAVEEEAFQKKLSISVDDVISSDDECIVVTRRSLRNKKVEDEKMEGTTKVLKKCLRENRLSISTDDVTSDDISDDDCRVVTRRSLRHKKVEDDKMGKMEDITKVKKKSLREKKLEEKNVAVDDEAGEKRESDDVPVNAHNDKALRRSKRNVTQVEDYKLLTGKNREAEVVDLGRSRRKITAAETNDLKANNDVDMVAKEDVAAGENVRRSKRHASRQEASNVLGTVVGETNRKQEPKEQRRRPLNIRQQKTAEVDNVFNEGPVRPSLPYANRNAKAVPKLVRGNALRKKSISKELLKDTGVPKEPQNQKEILKEPSLAAESSFCEEVIFNEQSSIYVQLTVLDKDPPVGENTRRSRRMAAEHGPPIVVDNVTSDANAEQEARKRRKSCVNVQEVKAAEVTKTFERPVRRSSRKANRNEEAALEPIEENAPEEVSAGSIEAQQEKSSLNKPQKDNERLSEPAEVIQTFERPVRRSSRNANRNEEAALEPIEENSPEEVSAGSIEAQQEKNSSNKPQKDRERSSEPAEVIQTFERPVRRSSRNANRNEEAAPEPIDENAPEEVSAGSIDAQQEKRSSNKAQKDSERSSEPSVKAKGTSPKKATTEEKSCFYVQLTIAEKEGNSVGESMSLERHTSRTEPSIVLDNLVSDTTNDQQEATNQTGRPNNFQEEESAEVDQTLIEGPVQQSRDAYTIEAAAPEPLEENSPQREKESSRKSQKKKKISTVPQKEKKRKFEERFDKSSLEVDFFPEQLATQEQPIKGQLNLFVQLTITENADSMGHQSPNETELFVEDIIDKREEPEKSSIQEKLHEGTGPSLPEAVDLQDDNTEVELETSQSDGRAATAGDVSVSKEINRSQVLEGHFHFSNTEDLVACFSNETSVSQDGAFAEPRSIEGPGPSVGECFLKKFTDTDHSVLSNQSDPFDEPEKILTREVLSPGKQLLLLTHFIDHVAQVGRSSARKKKESVEQHGNSRMAELDDDDDLTNNVKNFGTALVQRATSSSTGGETLDAEEVNERYRNIGQELTWDETERIDEYKLLDDQYDCSERGQESDSPDLSRINPSTTPEDGNLNAGECSSMPADFLGKVPGSILATNETVESKGTGSESESISQIGKAEESHEANSNLEGSVESKGTGSESESISQIGKAEESHEANSNLEGSGTGSESESISQIGKAEESHEANSNLEGSGVKEDSGTFVESEDNHSQDYAIHDKESLEEFSNNMAVGKDLDQREQSVKLLNHDAVTKDSNEDRRDIQDLKMDCVRDGHDTVSGAELHMTVLAFEDLPANTIGDRFAAIEGNLSSGTKGKAEKESHERLSGGESTSVKTVERHANEPADVCSHVVASPGEGLANLFATPVSLSSPKEKMHNYYHGEISCDRTSVEKTESIQKEQSCLAREVFSRDEQGDVEVWRQSRSASAAVQLTKPNISFEEKVGLLDYQDTYKHQHRSEPTHPPSNIKSCNDLEYNLSPSFETGHNQLCCDKLTNDTDSTVLVETETKNIQEPEACNDVSQECKLSNEQGLHEDKDGIHSAKDNSELDSQNLGDLQYSIAKDFVGLTESDVTDTAKFADELPSSFEASHCHDLLTNDAETVVMVEPEVENFQGTNVHVDVNTEYMGSIEQENNEVKEEIISVSRLESNLDNPHFSSKDLRGMMERNAADSMEFPISPSIETAHNSLENVSIIHKAENMDLVEEVEKVQEIDNDGTPKGQKALFEQEVDEEKDSHSTMKNTELDIQVVDPQPSLCNDFVELKESEITDVMRVAHSLSSSIEADHDSMLCDSLVNNEEVMALVDSRAEMVQESDENDDAGQEDKAEIEHEDGEEKDQIHFDEKLTELDSEELLDTQSSLCVLGQELEESFHAMNVYTDSGAANNLCASIETATDPLYNETLTNDAGMTVLEEIGEEKFQGTDDRAAGMEYTALVEQQYLEEKEGTNAKTKIVESNTEELVVPQSSNCEDCLESKYYCVADTVKVSRDIKSPSTEDAGDTLHLDILPKGSRDQGASLKTRKEEAEETNTSFGANNASQESKALVERENNDVEDAGDLAEMDLVTAEGHTSQEENEPSTYIFDKVEVLNMPDLASVEHKGADAGAFEHIDLHNTYLSPSTESSSHLHIDMLTEKDEETVHASSEMSKPVLEAGDMMETDGMLISKTTEAVDGAFEDEVISERKTDLTQGNTTAIENEEKLESVSAVRKNVRTILIHGTPNKVRMTADMKENIATSKLENVGSLTAVRPARKRTALKDLLQQ